MHRDQFLIINQLDAPVSKIYLSGWNCSSFLILLASCQQTWMTYTIAACTVKNSWWWTEELSETCRVSFQNKFEKLLHLVGFIIRNLPHLRSHGRRGHLQNLLFWHSATRKILQVLYSKFLRVWKDLVLMEYVQESGQQTSLARNGYGLNYSRG